MTNAAKWTAAAEFRQTAPGPKAGARQQIRGCRWIHGDVGQPDWRYCQRPRLAHRSYCAEHHARSINPDDDSLYAAEVAECDLYMRDLPPPNDELEDE